LEPFAPDIKLKRPAEMELGPDGALYIIEFGTGWENNKDAQIVRIEHVPASPGKPLVNTPGAELSDEALLRFCREDIVHNEHLLMVRANMEPGKCHPFHHHPTREELIYVLSARAEQWVGKEKRILNPGETAFIPMGEVHGTYNPFDERLIFLASLPPAKADDPAMADVSTEEPWCIIQTGVS
jgi:quercetin dioxygenase-like cupin family protein